MREQKPVIAIPIGDPAGVGPEITVMALSKQEIQNAANCIVVGTEDIIKRAMDVSGVNMEIHKIARVSEAEFAPRVIELVDLDNIGLNDYNMGEVSAKCGRAAYEYIEKAVSLAMSGDADAVSTTPINKESLRAGGVPYIGHTEIFGALTNTEDPLTMFEVRGLRVFFLSRHVSLRKACDMVTKERIIDYVKRCTQMLEKLGVSGGTMAIAGLNPHSGEHGLFGWEEVESVYPAIDELKAQGYDVAGPIGADSVFYQALYGKYNSVLSLYHDQGHVATKTLDFERTISITGGMPILRTSVDHGTAFDIAGKGIVSSVSMEEAILIGAKYSPAFTEKK